MATLADLLDENRTRFHHLIKRSIQVARQQIENEEEAAPISDEARLRALNVLSYALNRADAWAETRDLLLAMVAKMERAGYREDWLRYLEAGLRQSQQQSDRLAEATLSLHCGHLYRLINDHNQAQALLNGSVERYQTLGNKRGEACALNQLAYLAWQQSHYDVALALAQAALHLLDDADAERAMSLSAIGLVAFQRRQWQAAEDYHRQALAIRTSYAQQREKAWSLQNLANALRGQGQYETAATYFVEALTLLTEIHDPVHQAIIQMNLGIVRQQQGEVRQALALYELAETTFRQFRDTFNLAKTLINQGVGYLTLGEWQKAEATCAESAALFQQINNQGEYLNAMDGVGISHLERGHYAQALAVFEMIAQHLPDIKDTYFYPSLSQVLHSQLGRAQAGVRGG